MQKNNQTKFKETEVELIPEEWEIFELENIVKSIIDYRGKTPKKTNSGIPLVTAKVVKNGRINFANSEYIAEDDYESWMRRGMPNAGDVVITTEAPLGEVAQLPDFKIALAQRIITLSGKDNILNNAYLKYYFLSPVGSRQLKIKETGSVVTGVKQSELRRVKVITPPFFEQKQIAEILSSIDDKMELNRKINANLEKTTGMLFKQWFVDFEFPNENGQPYKSSNGNMVASEIGEIPNGWRIATLGEFIDLDRGLSYKGKHLREDGMPMLNLGTFDIKGGMKFDGLKFYDGVYKEKNLVRPGDIVIANTDITQSRNVLGSAVMVSDNFSTNSILFTHHVYAVRFLKKISKHFLYSLLTTSGFKSNAISYATGTTVLFLPKDAVSDYKFIVPSKTVQDMYDNVIADISRMIETNNNETFRLTELRETLLPRLMNGKIRVIS